MTAEIELRTMIEALEPLLLTIQNANRLSDKLSILLSIPSLQQFVNAHVWLKNFLNQASLKEQYVLASLLAIGQGEIIFYGATTLPNLNSQLHALLSTLHQIESHYDAIGGIIGYHLTVIKLIAERNTSNVPLPSTVQYHHPVGTDIIKENEEVRITSKWGLDNMPYTVEIYPIGGAGDRLNLHDPQSREALPAAYLLFNGRTLIESLIRDLQGREYLHYKLFGKQIHTPIALMTSHEKNNHEHIKKICADHNWFGRPPASFHIFTQPLVPMISIEGNWVMQGPLQVMVKPGGHGVIWKLIQDSGVLDALIAEKFRYGLVRQINNPVAGTDYGLSALAGWGSHYKKSFGFASCPRLLGTAEGMNVLIESKVGHAHEYKITNIEYTEFEHRGVHDKPEFPGSPYSRFPANTNILFINLEEIKKAVAKNPFPGRLVNMKNSVHTQENSSKTVPAGRLESTMQNIADYMIDSYTQRLNPITSKDLQTFVTYNVRRKTIAATKKSYEPGSSALETPEGCFFEMMENHRELLVDHCGLQMPSQGSLEDNLKNGPSFIVLFNPGLGPWYSVIAQKISGGQLTKGSELQLEIAELQLQDLYLEGSLLIKADNPLGKEDASGIIYYGIETGKCILRSVKIINHGIDYKANNCYWKNEIARKEALEIILHGNAEFYADNVTFNGAHHFEVPDGHRMVVTMQGNKIHTSLEEISAPTWHWSYTFDAENRVSLDSRQGDA